LRGVEREPRGVRLAGGVGRLASLSGGGGKIGAQTLHGLAHSGAHLVGEPTHTVGEVVLDRREFALACVELGAPRLGDLVDGLAAVDRLGDEPFVFELRSRKAEFRIEFYDTSSPTNWRLLRPDLVVLCYDISQRTSLINLQKIVSSAAVPFPRLKPGTRLTGLIVE
jgi:hypothetical protein